MDAMTFFLYLIAEKFHLFILSLNGQILLNHAVALTDKIFSSNWYDIPVKYQKSLYMMTIRCSKACMLSAGGLYDMNIENFGKTVKACISYFTMFLSVRG
nr:PREDICTED: odorant receptor 33b-like isoform X2 [Megachile rotundata]